MLIYRHLKKCLEIFGFINDRMIAELAGDVDEIDLHTGETLFTIGDPDDSLYVVTKGCVRVAALLQKPSATRYPDRFSRI